MYKKLKNCLLFPRQIAQYIDDKFSKNLIYFLILMFLYCIPSVAKLCCLNTINSSYGESIVEEFTSLDYKIGYKIENNNLVATTTTPEFQFFDTAIYYGNFEIPIYVTYSLDSINYEELNIHNATVFLVKFGSNNVEVSMYTSSNSSSGMFSVNGSTNETRLFNKTYEELNFSDVDFSMPNSIYFKNQILSTVNTIFNGIMKKYLVLFIIADFIITSFSLVLSLFIMTLLIYLFISGLGIKFKKIFTIFMLCATPSVITEILYQLTGNILFYLLGNILIFFYVIRAFVGYLNLTNKKLK